MEYEDDLDLTWVSVTHQEPEWHADLCLYDNRTFQLLRKMELGVMESVDEVS